MTGRQILHQISNELKSENRIWNIKFMEKDLNGKMIHFGDYRFDSETETIEKMGQTDFVFEKDNFFIHLGVKFTGSSHYSCSKSATDSGHHDK